jgi:transmembrane sensor
MRNEQIYQEASEWFVRMRDGEDSPGLMEWLRRSPEHVSAYLDIAAIWMEAKNVEVDSDLHPAARIAAALADKEVAELTPRGEQQTARRSRSRRGWLAFAASVAFLILGSGVQWYLSEYPTYATGLGEQRSIALRDGSTIALNSASRVRVHLTDQRRTIELLRGQALFHVAKDASRPFIVHAEDTAVRAVGTVFDVHRMGDGAVVTVVEGAVLVERKAPASAARRTELDARGAEEAGGGSGYGSTRQPFVSVRLTAGKQAVIRSEAALELKPVNVQVAIGWTRRELIFEFTPLAEAAAEFNRYNERRLIIEGDELRAFKISAVFRSTDPGALVRYLKSLPGVRIQENESSVVISNEDQ